MARPAKPMELKILQGTDRADRTNKRAPSYPKLNKIPVVPDVLKKKKGADKIWRRICGNLIEVGMLNQVNVDLVVAYVIEVATYQQANKEIDSYGLVIKNKQTGIPTNNPARRIASDSMKNMMTIAREFGLTPSTSQKIIIDEPPTPTKRRSTKKTPAQLAQDFGI